MASDYTKRSRTFRSVRKMDLARDLDNAFQSVEAEIDDTTSVSASELIANLAQANWWIDPVSGNDSNTGVTVGSPLKTWKEFERRMSGSPRPSRVDHDITITILSSWTNDSDPITCDFLLFTNAHNLYIVGVPTVVRSGTLTALSQARTPASNLHWRFTDSGVTDWSSDAGVNRRIKITSGAASGAYGSVQKNVGAGVAQFGPFTLITNSTANVPTHVDVSPVGNETYNIESLPECFVSLSGGGFGQSASATGNIIFEHLAIGRTGGAITRIENVGMFLRFVNCVFPTTAIMYGSNVTCMQVQFNGASQSFHSRFGNVLSIQSGLIRAVTVINSGGALSIGFTNLHVLTTGTLSPSSTASISIIGYIGFEVTGTGLSIGSGATVTMVGGTPYLFGTATTYGVGVSGGGASFAVVPAAADHIYLTGGTQDFWCHAFAPNVTILDDSVSPPTIRTIAQTWANFRAPAPAGMGYRCHPLNSNSYIGSNSITSVVDPTANLSQADWWIDPVSGLDSNTGITVGSPLKTWKEFERRTSIGSSPTIQTTSMTITFLSSQPDDTDPVRPHLAGASAKYLKIVGTKTLVRSGTFTALSQTRTPASNLHWRFTDSLVADWTSDIGKQIVLTSGASSGAVSYVWKNVGAGVAQFSAWIIDAGLPAAFPTLTDKDPVGNETYNVYSLPKISIQTPNTPYASTGTSLIVFEDLDISTNGSACVFSNTRTTIVARCVFSGGLTIYKGQAFAYNCMMPSGKSVFIQGASTSTLGGGLYLGAINIQNRSNGSLSNFVAVSSVVVSFADSFFINVAVEASAIGIQITRGSHVRSSGRIYGTAGTYGIQVDASSTLQFSDTTRADEWTLVGTTQDFSIGPLAANVNIFDDSVSPALVQNIAQTLANFKAAAPGGMGYRCAPIRTRGYIGIEF